MIASWPATLLGVAAGAAVASYATTAAMRWTRSEASAMGRSHCDGCGVALPYARTIPVVSYLQLGGVCAACGGRIDRVHLWSELTGAVVGGLIAATLRGPSALLMGGLAALLLAAAVADLRTLRLPDTLSVGVALAGAGLAWLHGGGSAVALGLVAAAMTLAVLVGVREFSARMRGKQNLGLGDVKLLAALAVWLGVATPWAVVVGSVLGLAGMALLQPADGRLPFGPYIAVAAWLVGLGGEWGWWPTTL